MTPAQETQAAPLRTPPPRPSGQAEPLLPDTSSRHGDQALDLFLAALDADHAATARRYEDTARPPLEAPACRGQAPQFDADLLPAETPTEHTRRLAKAATVCARCPEQHHCTYRLTGDRP